GGLLAHRTAMVDGGAIDYPAVARWQAGDDMIVSFTGAAATHRLKLSPEFARSFQIETVQPAPQAAAAGPEGLELRFDIVEPTAEVSLHLRALSPGVARYRVGIDGKPARDLTTYILP